MKKRLFIVFALAMFSSIILCVTKGLTASCVMMICSSDSP